ncbi:hypothetical protein [Actinomadura litoris]|uniref:hypothetical protein n=1 Tax=Actinomadura litoris TaxID=2678616 RepID=UPI002342F021|nr:hypothetical protein [Actinomadura litoris]
MDARAWMLAWLAGSVREAASQRLWGLVVQAAEQRAMLDPLLTVVAGARVSELVECESAPVRVALFGALLEQALRALLRQSARRAVPG